MPEFTIQRPRRLALGLIISSGLLLGASAAYMQTDAANAQATTSDVPKYEVLEVFDAGSAQEIAISTKADREAGMRMIAEEVRDDYTPDNGTLLVEYYDKADTSENTGFALVFDSKKAVLDTGASQQFGDVYSKEDARQIIEDEGGIRVVSYENFAEDNGGLWDRIQSFLS